ncbi:unnamed protein product [Sphagnum balticum]
MTRPGPCPSGRHPATPRPTRAEGIARPSQGRPPVLLPFRRSSLQAVSGNSKGGFQVRTFSFRQFLELLEGALRVLFQVPSASKQALIHMESLVNKSAVDYSCCYPQLPRLEFPLRLELVDGSSSSDMQQQARCDFYLHAGPAGPAYRT